MSVTW